MSYVVTSLMESGDGSQPVLAFIPGDRVPSLGLAVLTCMDARIDPLAVLGLRAGDAHILRNAGGRVTPDVLRSVAVSTHVLGVREVGVVQHTGCGLESPDDGGLARRTGLVDVDFLAFRDVEASVSGDVDALAASGYLADGTVVWGAVLDLEGGVLRLVRKPTARS